MKTFKIFSICFCLSTCNAPTLFWEEEGRKIIDDIVLEEEKLGPSPPPKARPLKKKRSKNKETACTHDHP